MDGLAPTQGDRILQRLTDAGYDGVVLVPANPRALDVVVPYSTEKGARSLFRPQVAIVDQSSSIRLTTSGYSYFALNKSPRGGR